MMAVENAPAIAAALVAGRRPRTHGRRGLRGDDAGSGPPATPTPWPSGWRRRRCPAAGDHRGRWGGPGGAPGTPSRRWPPSSSSPTLPTPARRLPRPARRRAAGTSRPSTSSSQPRREGGSAAPSPVEFPPCPSSWHPGGSRGLADRLARLRRTLLRRPSPHRGLTGFHVHRGALARSNVARYRRSPRSPRVRGQLLVLEDIVDHTNVGAVEPQRCRAQVRRQVLLAPQCADPLYRRAIKVGMGPVFRRRGPGCRTGTTSTPPSPGAGFTTVALTLADDAIPLEDAVAGLDRVASCSAPGPRISPRWEGSADRRAIIPMAAGIDSLNVAAPPPSPATSPPGADRLTDGPKGCAVGQTASGAENVRLVTNPHLADPRSSVARRIWDLGRRFATSSSVARTTHLAAGPRPAQQARVPRAAQISDAAEDRPGVRLTTSMHHQRERAAPAQWSSGVVRSSCRRWSR